MKKPFVQKSILGIIVIGFVTILAGTLINIKGTNGTSKPMVTGTATPSETPGATNTSIGIVKKIDNEAKNITITDVSTRRETVYSYTGGTNVTSRYGKVLMVSNLQLGEIVKATYERATNKVTDIEITTDAWEYKDVSNWSIDKSTNTFYLGSQTFKYGELFQVFDQNGLIDSNALSEKDRLTVKGMNGQVYSVIVSKGHGTFMLSNYSKFVGGTIEVGYDVMTEVEEDQVFTLTEGDYRVTVKKGKTEAVKYVHITAGEVTTLDLKEYQNQSAQQGKVRFNISPEGADLYINNVETDYSSEISLEYGEYDVKVSCTGYETFSEKLTVGKSSETLYINLVESSLSKATATPSATEKASETTSPTTSAATIAPTITATPTAATATPSVTAAASLTQDADHTISISGPSGVSVYINDEYKGTLPLTMTKIIGSNIKCTLKKEGQSDKTYTLTVTDDKTDVNWTFSQWW